MTNVAQHPLGDTPPTRSPTLWSVTSAPTAVTTPAKSVPGCGSCPSAVGYWPNAANTSAKLMLDAVTATSICPGPGATRSNATNSMVCRSPGVRSCRRMPSRVWSTRVVRPSSARSAVGAQARRVPLVVAPGGLVLVGAGQQLARHLLGAGLLVDVDVGGPQVRVLGADHPQQTAQAALLEIDPVAVQHRLGAPGHHVQPGRLAGDLAAARGRCAPRARRTRRRAGRTPRRGCRSSVRSPRRRRRTRLHRADRAAPRPRRCGRRAAARTSSCIRRRAASTHRSTPLPAVGRHRRC